MYQKPLRFVLPVYNVEIMVEKALNTLLKEDINYRYNVQRRNINNPIYSQLLSLLTDAFMGKSIYNRISTTIRHIPIIDTPMALFKLLTYIEVYTEGLEGRLYDNFEAYLRGEISKVLKTPETDNPYSEWRVDKEYGNYVIHYLGDYRIRRYHEAVKHGILTE